MFAEKETLVGGVNHDGIRSEARFVEVVEDFAQIVVDPFHAAKIALHVFLVNEPALLGTGFHGLDRRGELGVDRTSPDLLRRLIDGGRTARTTVHEVVRFGNLDVGEVVGVAMRMHPEIVRRFVVQHIEEGPVRIAHLLEPIERLLRDDVVCVPPLVGGFLSLHYNPGRIRVAHLDELGVVIPALAGQHRPMIESLWIGFQVILPDKTGLITVRLHVFGQGRLALIEPRKLIDAVQVGILAGHDRRPARCADRIDHKGLRETHPFGGEPVQIRGRRHFCQTPAIRADRVRGMVVRHDEENVGPGRRASARRQSSARK